MSNIQNGGLIYKGKDEMILAEVSKGKGMSFLEKTGNFCQSTIMPWFINSYDMEDAIYYSNALKDNYLCRMIISDQLELVVLKEPVYMLQLYQDKLYYINENNRHLYCYSLREKEATKLISEEISTFTIAHEKIWYGGNKGIISAQLNGQGKDKVTNHEATKIVCNEEYLFFIDKEANYAVSYIPFEGGQLQTIPDSMSTSLNVYEDCVFYNNVKDKSHIYRYSVASEFNIKFIPERADYIHIIDDTIYYLNQDKKIWMQVSTHGGKPAELIK